MWEKEQVGGEFTEEKEVLQEVWTELPRIGL